MASVNYSKSGRPSALRAQIPWLDSGPRPQLKPERLLSEAAGTRDHQGIVAWCEPFRYADAYELAKQERPLLVCLDQVTDPHNLGAVVRSAEGAGATAVIVPAHGSVRVTPAVCRSSAGAVEHLPVAVVPNLARYFAEIKGADLWAYAADSEGSHSMWNSDLTGGVALVLGAEGKGVRPLVRRTCDAVVSIPLVGACRIAERQRRCGGAALRGETPTRRRRLTTDGRSDSLSLRRIQRAPRGRILEPRGSRRRPRELRGPARRARGRGLRRNRRGKADRAALRPLRGTCGRSPGAARRGASRPTSSSASSRRTMPYAGCPDRKCESCRRGSFSPTSSRRFIASRNSGERGVASAIDWMKTTREQLERLRRGKGRHRPRPGSSLRRDGIPGRSNESRPRCGCPASGVRIRDARSATLSKLQQTRRSNMCS